MWGGDVREGHLPVEAEGFGAQEKRVEEGGPDVDVGPDFAVGGTAGFDDGDGVDKVRNGGLDVGPCGEVFH